MAPSSMDIDLSTLNKLREAIVELAVNSPANLQLMLEKVLVLQPLECILQERANKVANDMTTNSEGVGNLLAAGTSQNKVAGTGASYNPIVIDDKSEGNKGCRTKTGLSSDAIIELLKEGVDIMEGSKGGVSSMHRL